MGLDILGLACVDQLILTIHHQLVVAEVPSHTTTSQYLANVRNAANAACSFFLRLAFHAFDACFGGVGKLAGTAATAVEGDVRGGEKRLEKAVCELAHDAGESNGRHLVVRI